MRQLLLGLRSYEGVDFPQACKAVITTLTQRTNKKLDVPQLASAVDVNKFGRQVDVTCDTVFCYHKGEPEYPAKLLVRLFGAADSESDGE
ncbi:unnamed protein product [Sphagnum jensenii]|uniref:Uncharacterized protein n=1 Tax=Sphagnum jensenii TaxID=128206 RepID=A0ABP0V9X2_9BRYO